MVVVPFQLAFKRNYGRMRIKHDVLRQLAFSRQRKFRTQTEKQLSDGNEHGFSCRRNAFFSFVVGVYVPVIP